MEDGFEGGSGSNRGIRILVMRTMHCRLAECLLFQ